MRMRKIKMSINSHHQFNLLIYPVLLAFFLLSSSLQLVTGDASVSSEDQPASESSETSGSPQVEPVVPEVSSDQDVVITYTPLNLDNENLAYFLYESFDDELAFNNRWTQSKATKAESQEFKYDGEWAVGPSHSKIKGDGALILKTRAKHHAISARTKSIVEPAKERSIVVQYEVQFRKGQECGGAYLKLLASPSGSLESLNDKTQYSIMFGPDKCGNDHKVHFIFNHKNPKNGTLREIHWRKSGSVLKLDDVVKDGKWHHFRLHIRSDNSFEIQMDKKIVGKGSLLEDFSPAVNPPKEIPDVTDSKPEDWDEREKIPDPDAVKPDDWDENEPRKIPDPAASKPKDWNEDEPEMIPDPEAEKPSDWDPDMDGEWEAPLISNPKCTSLSGCGVWKAPLIDNPLYKGKWKPSLISNPNYRGKWSPRMIENPEFFEDPYPSRSLLPIDAVAFELWTISDEIAFDNILITNDVDVANHVLDLTFQPKKELADEETDSFFIRMIKYTNKKPWLWAVYVLIIALPVVLFIAYCCIEPVSKKSSAGDDELIGQRKKTDDPTPDSVQTPTLCVTPSPEEESATEPSVSPLKKFMDESKTASSAASSAKTTSKSEVTQDNDEYEEEEVEEEEIEVEEDEDVDDDQAVGADEPEEEEEVDEDNLTAGDGLKGDEPSPPRRRKTRSSKK